MSYSQEPRTRYGNEQERLKLQTQIADPNDHRHIEEQRQLEAARRSGRLVLSRPSRKQLKLEANANR